jgi:hypothetical protein
VRRSRIETVNRRKNVRLKALFSMAVLGIAGSALAQAPAAPPAPQNVVVENKTESVTVVVKETPKPPDFVFELHGFTSVSLWFQDAGFGLNATNPTNGQLAVNVIKTFPTDTPLFGADVRQTRLNFSLRGPQILGGAVPKAVVELDFVGGDGPGGFGDVSVWPRLRLAYTELNWGGKHIIQLGQQNMLIIGLIPQSLRGIAVPMSYTAGTVGWRQPGIFGYHTFGSDVRFEFAWSIQRSGWANTLQTDFINAGVSSGLPAFEARGKLSFGKMLDFWISGHWQQADRNGPGVLANDAAMTTITTALGTVGLKLDLGMLVLQGSAWYGKNAGPVWGSFFTFSTINQNIFGYGGWAQIGLVFSKEFSLWYMYGIDHPSYTDIFLVNGATLRNQNGVAMIRYQTGGFAFGVEWLNSRTTQNHSAFINNLLVGTASGSANVPVAGVVQSGATAGTACVGGSANPTCGLATTNTQAQLNEKNVLIGNQISLSANYYF